MSAFYRKGSEPPEARNHVFLELLVVFWFGICCFELLACLLSYFSAWKSMGTGVAGAGGGQMMFCFVG